MGGGVKGKGHAGGYNLSHFATFRATRSPPCFLIAHSQTTFTRHPALLSATMFRLSLATFSSNLRAQKSGLVAGVVVKRHPLCLCQKQPCTKITAPYPGKTRSGLPGRPLP